MRKIGFVVMVMACFGASPIQATPIDSVDLGGHLIELISMNEFDGEFYVWTYKVTSGDPPAISHWVLDFCVEFFHDASEDWDEYAFDPTTGVTGIKFDTGYDDGEMREVKLYLTKAVLAVETDLSVGLKAGQGEFTGTILAPSCDEVPEPATMALLAAGVAALAGRRRRFI